MFEKPLYGFDDIPGIKPDRGKNDPDQDRQQDKPADHRQGRTAEKAIKEGLGRSRVQGLSHRNPPGAEVGLRRGYRTRCGPSSAPRAPMHCLTLTTCAKLRPPPRYRPSRGPFMAKIEDRAIAPNASLN